MDLKKADALFYLRWMFDAGADEAISEAPFNRFTEANSRKFENLRPVKKNEGEKVGLTVAEGESFKKKIGFNSKKLQEAYKVAKDCNTLDEIVESIEQPMRDAQIDCHLDGLRIVEELSTCVKKLLYQTTRTRFKNSVSLLEQVRQLCNELELRTVFQKQWRCGLLVWKQPINSVGKALHLLCALAMR